MKTVRIACDHFRISADPAAWQKYIEGAIIERAKTQNFRIALKFEKQDKKRGRK